MFDYCQPTRIHFGEGRLEEIASICGRYGKRGFMVTTPDAPLQPLYDRIKKYFEQADIHIVHFDKVEPNPSVEMIEFHICKKYHLESQLPILIYEKMGPHIAIGDPCYRGAEDEPVFNLLDGKEIVAKTNERTERAVSDAQKYVFKHIDITLPYDEVKTMYGYDECRNRIEFLNNGKFVLKGTEKLNEGMEGEM